MPVAKRILVAAAAVAALGIGIFVQVDGYINEQTTRVELAASDRCFESHNGEHQLREKAHVDWMRAHHVRPGMFSDLDDPTYLASFDREFHECDVAEREAVQCWYGAHRLLWLLWSVSRVPVVAITLSKAYDVAPTVLRWLIFPLKLGLGIALGLALGAWLIRRAIF